LEFYNIAKSSIKGSVAVFNRWIKSNCSKLYHCSFGLSSSFPGHVEKVVAGIAAVGSMAVDIDVAVVGSRLVTGFGGQSGV
jgi:hypothetical protein